MAQAGPGQSQGAGVGRLAGVCKGAKLRGGWSGMGIRTHLSFRSPPCVRATVRILQMRTLRPSFYGDITGHAHISTSWFVACFLHYNRMVCEARGAEQEQQALWV